MFRHRIPSVQLRQQHSLKKAVQHRSQQHSVKEQASRLEELEKMGLIKLSSYEPGGIGFHTIKDMVEKEVTPSVAKILSRMNVAPRSFGSISPPAHIAGAVACNTMNLVMQREASIEKLNPAHGPFQSCGEGGEHPSRYGTIAASLDHQVASGRWGAGLQYLATAKRLGIKISQGVKPGTPARLCSQFRH